MFLLHEKNNNLSHHATISHMPRQLSCRGMSKIVTWLDHVIQNFSKTILALKFLIVSS